jgi:hypothetical protein
MKRSGIALILAASVVALAAPFVAEAQPPNKVDICHRGMVLNVAETAARGGHAGHGDCIMWYHARGSDKFLGYKSTDGSCKCVFRH